jgi:ABC-type hemin transport system substrate-binding protein
MIKNPFKRKGSAESGEALERLTLELAEIEEIAEKLFRRMEERLEALKAVEARLDERVRAIESLIARAGSIGAAHGDTVEARRRGVLALARKGLKVDEIAGIFDMTRGEVELILNLDRK